MFSVLILENVGKLSLEHELGVVANVGTIQLAGSLLCIVHQTNRSVSVLPVDFEDALRNKDYRLLKVEL